MGVQHYIWEKNLNDSVTERGKFDTSWGCLRIRGGDRMTELSMEERPEKNPHGE